jgi:hypothetical protein
VDPLVPLIAELTSRAVQFVIIGVAGANYYAVGGSTIFTTQDRDLFLPPDADNLLRAWVACDAIGLSLWAGAEPLDVPRDRLLAERVVERRTTVRAMDDRGLQVDFTLIMAGFEFDTVWRDRRTFRVEDVAVPVARLIHIITSKHAAGRDKDRLFLATHREALEQLLRREP